MPPKARYGTLGNFSGKASEHPLYFRWINMMRRCYEPSCRVYRAYGGRGVKVEPYLQVFSNYVDFVSGLPNYCNLLSAPNEWQIDKDIGGGNEYSRGTIRIIPSRQNLEIENAPKRMPVFRVLPDGTKEKFQSISDAEHKTKIHRGNIARSARNGVYKAGGYVWGYAFD